MEVKAKNCVFALIFSLLLAPHARAEAGLSDDRILLGTSSAISEPFVYGKDMGFGAKAFFDELNKRGGVQRRQVDIVTHDDEYQPEKMLENTKTLVEVEKVFALFGFVGTPTTAAVLPYISKTNVPLLFAYTGAEFLRKPVVANIFNLRASYGAETYELATFAVKELKINDFGIFYQDDAYGTAGKAGIDRALSGAGLKAKVTGVYVRNQNSADSALEEILKLRPKAVFLISVKKSAIDFIQKAASKGYRPIYLAPSPVGTLDIIEAMGKEADNIYLSEVLPLPTDTSFELVKDYQHAMKAAGFTKFSHVSLESYFNSAVLAEALRRSGRELTRDGLMKSLEDMTDTVIKGVRVHFSPEQHQGLTQIFLVHVKAGNAQPVKKLR